MKKCSSETGSKSKDKYKLIFTNMPTFHLWFDFIVLIFFVNIDLSKANGFSIKCFIFTLKACFSLAILNGSFFVVSK